MAVAKKVPVLDVRSPLEYQHAHIPGAISFPLFTNEERKQIGTQYKQISREKAIKTGLDAFGKNLVKMVEDAERIANESNSREFAVHCWRGGMRSSAVAWLLDLYGFKVYLLTGGYKAYRNYVLQQFEKKYQLLIVGGYTGGNKTGVLHELRKRNEAVIDLEGLAGHMGSAFGNLNQVPQPGQEQFENLLARELLQFQNTQTPIWLEGESQRIGAVNIPKSFFVSMRNSPLLFLNVPFEQRLKHITETYGHFEKEKLVNAIIRIKKRLGGLETKTAINALLEDNVSECFAILLNYYDRVYLKSTLNTSDGERPITTIAANDTNAKTNTEKILEHVRTIS